jgi:hypothetical protein
MGRSPIHGTSQHLDYGLVNSKFWDLRKARGKRACPRRRKAGGVKGQTLWKQKSCPCLTGRNGRA